MFIVDTALEMRRREGLPIRVGVVGAGYSGGQIVHQIVTSCPAIHVACICNRSIPNAIAAYHNSGVVNVLEVHEPRHLDAAIDKGRYAVTDSVAAICDAEQIDVVLECTGTVEYGAAAVLQAISGRKHIVLLNAELDATLGPILKRRADIAGLVYTNADGDEPGVAMNMIRFVRSLGLEPVVAGNLKGLYDPYRTPESQAEFAKLHDKDPAMMASFADGTKMSMELAVLANATGFTVTQLGMHGPSLEHVNDSTDFFRDKLIPGGMVDFLVGAKPANGAFVLGRTDDSYKQDYLRYLKMGSGPLYAFYTPFHLPHLEVPLTLARAVLFGDATITPSAGHICDVVAVAKKALSPGEMLDGFGGYCCYSLLDRAESCVRKRALPMGVSHGCTLVRSVEKDQVLCYDDIALPEGRSCDLLRADLVSEFHGISTN